MIRIAVCAAIALLFGVVTPEPASAREDFCLNSNGSLNKTATRGYRQIERSRNQTLMRRINGIWYNRTVNPGTGQVSDLWQAYEGAGNRAGLYSYCNIVCDASFQFCSRYQGVGLWAVRGNRNGFKGMRITSDQSLNHFCQIIDGRLSTNANFWRTSSDAVLQRVPSQPCPLP